jgi:uncharacterized protein GlcG (DUF336 family)
MAGRFKHLGTGIVGAAIVTGAVVAGGHVLAQGTTPMPLARATVSPEAAKATLMKVQISADIARAIVDACVAMSKASTPPQLVSIFVLSPTGEIVDAHIMDGLQPIAIEAAMLKAKTALYARTSSTAVGQRFSTIDQRAIRMNFGKDQGLAYYFAAGGLPIVVDGQMIGAIGVGGGVGQNYDERCAHQAAEKVLGPQPPLVEQQQPAPAAPAGGTGGAPR